MSTALITGAGSGIGQATALTLAPHYHLVLCGRNVTNLEQTKAQCCARNPYCTVTLWPYDLTQIETLETDFKACLASLPEDITKFAHCAGSGRMKHLHLLTADDFLVNYRLHCVSAALLIKTLASRANQRALDAVVLVGSHNNSRAVLGYSHYQAAKAAAETMMRCMAIELAPKVRLNMVKPGLTQTPIAQDIFDNPEMLVAYQERAPSGWAQPQDIADVIAFLLSAQARMVTGEAIIVDGGTSIDGSVHLHLRK